MLKRQPEIDVVRCFTELGYTEKRIFSDHEPLTSSFVFGTIEPDITPPVWIVDFPKITGITNQSANLYVKINEKGFIYYIVSEKDAPFPSVNQLKQAENSDNLNIFISGKVKANANGLYIIPIKELVSENEYKVHIIAEDDETIPNVISEITTLPFKTMTFGGLIKNHSFQDNFEGVPVNWSMITSGKFYINNSFGYDGNNSSYFETLTTSIGGREVVSEPFVIDKTRPINASAYFNTPNEVEQTKVSLKIYFYSDSDCKTLCGNSTMTSVSLKQKDIWEKLDYSVDSSKIPTDAISAKVCIRVSYVKDIGTANDKISDVRTEVRVVEERENNHYLQIQQQLEEMNTILRAAPWNKTLQ